MDQRIRHAKHEQGHAKHEQGHAKHEQRHAEHERRHAEHAQRHAKHARGHTSHVAARAVHDGLHVPHDADDVSQGTGHAPHVARHLGQIRDRNRRLFGSLLFLFCDFFRRERKKAEELRNLGCGVPKTTPPVAAAATSTDLGAALHTNQTTGKKEKRYVC